MKDRGSIGKQKPCATCEHCSKVIATGNWSFFGCRHEPYKGKMCSEIEKCPKEDDDETCGYKEFKEEKENNATTQRRNQKT